MATTIHPAALRQATARATTILVETRLLLLNPTSSSEARCWAEITAAWANLAFIVADDPEPLPRCTDYLARAEQALAFVNAACSGSLPSLARTAHPAGSLTGLAGL